VTPTPRCVGTRASALALWQTERVRQQLADHGVPTTRLEITTTGDHVLDVPLARIGSVALFTRQLDEALLQGRIDLAVHSLKDLPSRLPEGIALAAVSQREDPRDALVGRDGVTFDTLPHGAILATSSLRRRAQALRARPDLQIVDVRGNVQTRLRHLDETPAWSATLLAAAGLIRLDLGHRITDTLPTSHFLPAPGQGALAVTVRADDESTRAAVMAAVHDVGTGIATAAERGFLRALDGGCQVPIAAFADVSPVGGSWRIALQGRVIALDGTAAIEGFREAIIADAVDAAGIGQALGEALLAQGAGPLLETARRAVGHA
jgi:hydroxymethylbilane synthase